MTNSRPIPIVESISVQNIYEAPELKPIFDEFLVELPPSMLEIIKQFAERILMDITGIKGTLELSIVVDANQVISEAINYIRDGRLPLIIELSKTPFVKLYAPPSIREETLKDERKLEKISKKKGIPVEALKSAIEEILEHITFKVPEGYEEYKKAMKLVGERDPDDVDYVWLYFSINATAIVSSDKDITETTIKTWKNMGPLKYIEVILRRGSLSFVVLSLGGRAILEFLFKIILAVIGTILGILKVMWSYTKRIIAWISEGIQNLSELQALALFATLGAIVYYFGREIKEWAETLVNRVIEFLRSVKDFIISLLNIILDSLIVRALRTLMGYSAILIELYKEINLKDIEENVIKVGGPNESSG